MEQKSSNTLAIAIIALATVLIVAMICGMLMWMVDRNQSFNERLLDRQMQATARTAEPLPAQVTTPAPAPIQATTSAQPVAQTPAPAPQPAPEAAKTVTPAKTAATPTKKPTTTRQKPATKPTTSVPAKRTAPKETEAAQTRVGPDGQPEHRITLPVGNDDLDWQLQ